MRIEVARRLEGALPDIAARRIIDQQMAPRFRQGDYAGGLMAAAEAVAARLAGEDLSPPGKNRSQVDDRMTGMLVAVCMVAIFVGILRAFFGRRKSAAFAGLIGGGITFMLTFSIVAALIVAFFVWLIALSNGSGGGKSGSSSGSSSGGSGGSWGRWLQLRRRRQLR